MVRVALSGALVAGIGGWLLWKRTRPAHSHDHHHHHHDHSHEDGHEHHHHQQPISRGGLVSLGISGGMVPCPEALVVLMISVSLQKVGLGLALLVSFSLGLAAVLIAIGVAMVMAAPLVTRFTGERGWLRTLPIVSACVVTLLGVVLVWQSLARL